MKHQNGHTLTIRDIQEKENGLTNGNYKVRLLLYYTQFQHELGYGPSLVKCSTNKILSYMRNASCDMLLILKFWYTIHIRYLQIC
jgi:hypothetical protein